MYLILSFYLLLCFTVSISIVPRSVLDEESKHKIENDEDDGKSSLVFVFDTTGSMYNDLRQLRDGAGMILDTALEENGVIADFVFVPFHDPKVGPATVTKDKEVFKAALNAVDVYGGGDCPEKSLGGIQLALSVSRPRSFVYVFTDATASDHKLVGNVLDAVQRKQSQVVFVLTGHCNDLSRPHFKVYGQIAAASSGQVFNLNKTSVHKVLDFVKSSIRGRMVNLGSAVNPPGYDHKQEIPIDSNLKEVTVSVSGAKPSIKVVNPSGEELTGPPQLVTTLDLAEIMVVKVLQPEPGNWTFVTGSAEQHSVKVAGVSNVTFTHGFSVERPVTLAETSYRPLQGAYNHMMIKLTQAAGPVQVNYAEILALDGAMLFELPLAAAARNVYTAEPFVPPDDFFYIAINGRDEYNQELRRVGDTAVQAKPPSIPYLTVSKKVEARVHDSVTLTCNIESLVPVTARWTKDTARVQNETSSLQSTSIQYVISDMVEGSVGSYSCVARNVAGHSTATTEVTLIVDPPQVTIASDNPAVELGDNITVHCAAVSNALLLQYQLVFNGTDKHYVTDIDKEPNIEGLYVFTHTIYNASERDSGTYSCVASNRGGEGSVSTYISVQSYPLAQILGPHALTRLKPATFQLACHAEHARRVVWLDPKGRVVKDTEVEGSYNDMLDVKDVGEDGVWSCVAVRGSFNATDSVDITVLIKPEVSIEGAKNISITNGTKLEVVCNIIAKPTPRIIWHRETEDFLNNTVITIEPNKYRSVLTLDSSKEDVKGTYFCFGENSGGIHQDSITITVTRKITLEEGFRDMNVQLYSQITLPCRIDSYPPPTIVWYHNDTDLKTSDNLYLSENNNTLYILKMDFDNLGSYKCEANNGFEKMEVVGSLNVVGLEPPMLTKEPVQRTVLRGKPAILTCRVTKGNPQPILSWQYKGDLSSLFATLPTGGGVVANTDGSELIIADVTTLHTGMYRCVAENVIGKDLYDVQLVVHFPPEIVKEPFSEDKPLLIEAGRKVTLSCKSSGLPPPIVIWSKDHQPIRYSKNLYLTDTSDLVIEQAMEEDSGLFICNVTSALGSSQRNFTVVVYVLPVISPPAYGPTIEVLEGDLVELPCSAKGTPPPVVTWTFNGETVSGQRRYIDGFGLRFVANLTDFGEYTCIAKNLYGNASSTFFVYIWVAPYVEPLESVREVVVGSNASVECSAVGFPVPGVLWEFQGKLLGGNTTDLSFNDYGNLYITNATAKHQGVYSCVAENIAGFAKKYIHIRVNEPPAILADSFTGSYIATSEDSRLVIACRARGNPRPYFAWIKDGSYINTDDRYSVGVDGTLTIVAPSEELSGQYVCVAKNSLGTANKTVTVRIYPVLARMQADESQTSVAILEGSNASVECPIRAMDQDIVKWYKDAKLISTGLLVIPNITRDDSSTYACVVTNAIGSAYANVRVGVEWPPTLVANATNVEAVTGDDLYFDCGVDAKPAAKTKWLFNSKLILGEDKERLKLLNIQLRQTGVYKCIVNNRHGTITKQFTLDVLEPPFISEFDLLDVMLKEGMNATLDCQARGSPDPIITWSYNNTNWHVQNTSLTTYNVGRQSEGLYRCVAANKAGAARLVYRVGVTSPAAVEEIVLFREGQEGGSTVVGEVEVALNSHIRLSCKASGHPSIAVQWVHNGNIVSRNKEGISYADLVLQAKQSGEYTCVADNEGGTDQKRVKLDVLGPPQIFRDMFGGGNTSAPATRLEVVLGQSFHLRCHSYGNPAPAVYWFKDDLPLRLFDDTMVSSDYGEVIVSNGARIEQSGNYTCVARNKVGNASVVYLVDVLVPPPASKGSPKPVNIMLGKPLVLRCPVEGTPAPRVTWVKHPYTGIANDDPRIALVNDSSILIINKTEIPDSGRYSCIMTNKVGTTEVTFDVTVEKPPSIAGNVGDDISESLIVSLHRSIVMKCQADGNPPPRITWLKDTQELSSSSSNVHRVLGNSLLAVWGARAFDAGQYICVAENSGGSAHRRYNLIVQVPGKWSSWSEWSLCNVTCGLGYQHRSRSCHYTDDRNVTYDKSTTPDKIVLDSSGCKGGVTDRRRCHMPACSADTARWSAWAAWAPCSATCGAATQARTRRCRGGRCGGDNVQIRKCPNLPKCGDYMEQTTSSLNEVFNSQENNSETSAYIPEATFEINPAVVDQPIEVEEFYTKEQKYPTVFYEVNVTDNLDRSYRGACLPGYRANNYTGDCEDIDECVIENNKCHMTQVCANTPGAYRCSCPKGYFALGVGQRCLDINECSQDTSGCEFACVNTAGGYVCACPRGRRLRPDKHTCYDLTHATTTYSKPLSHEELYSGEYMSASVDFPARYLKNRN